MGKIKSKSIKKTAKSLEEKGVEFKGDFESNKKMLKNSLPSKKLRNQLAGLMAKTKNKH